MMNEFVKSEFQWLNISILQNDKNAHTYIAWQGGRAAACVEQ
jgi:hypothetical protein